MPAAVTETVTIRTSLSADETRAVVRGVLVGERAGVAQPVVDGWDAVRLGSRLGFRFWGMWFPNVEKRLPLITRYTTASDASGTTLSLVFENDEGWYITRLSVVDDLFRSTFASIAAQIASRLPSVR